MSRRVLAAAILLAALLAGPAAARAEGDEATFVETLRRSDPAAAERYVALRDAREKAVTELRRVEGQYSAAGTALQPAFVLQLTRARKTYAETSLALLDFLDARDREALASYQAAISRIGTLLEERKQARVDLERMLRDK